MGETDANRLQRHFGLLQATALNVTMVVGAGIFVTIPIMLGLLPGPYAVLAWVAAGRFDAFWERNLAPWDMAAGVMLVREAGGFVTDLDDGDAMFTKGHIAAGNDTIHRELLRLIKTAEKA